MIGGLFKSASRLALVAAAGVLVGGVSAQAADLGGDCCADLEERVAELEATTVRKGNRKVSLTLSGSVHKSIVYWDDGVESNVYAGVDSINLSTRFRFLGEAKITPKVSAGYLLEIEGFGDFNSSQMNQVEGRGALGTTLNVRHSAWWIDHKDMGRVWVGLTDAAGQGIDTINLANTNVAAHPKFGLTTNGFFLRGNVDSQTPLGRTWANINGANSGFVNLSDETRNNVIKYVSPTMMGFIFSAAWGEDDMWDVALRYAGEFGGFKLAAGATYTQVTDANPNNAIGASNHFNGCADVQNAAPALGITNDRDCSSWVLGGSLMHVATGLFVSGSYGQRQDNARGDVFAALGTTAFDDTETFWHVKAGIEQNWFGIGKTTLYGEYNVYSGTPLTNGALSVASASMVSGAQVGDAIAKSEITVWGLGIVQAIDAAAMDLYLAYRNHSADVSTTPDGVNLEKINGLKDLQTITMGGIIRF